MDHDVAGLTVSLKDDSPIAHAQARISAALEPSDVRRLVWVCQQDVQGVGNALAHRRIELAHLPSSGCGDEELPGV